MVYIDRKGANVIYGLITYRNGLNRFHLVEKAQKLFE